MNRYERNVTVSLLLLQRILTVQVRMYCIPQTMTSCRQYIGKSFDPNLNHKCT